MNAYHPPQRAIRAHILSVARWIRGTFHIPKLHAFDDHLSHHGRTFFTLTEVELGSGPALPFLALRASAARVIVPDGPEEPLHLTRGGGTRAREVSCYLEHLAVHGSLDLLPTVRTSDFLAHQESFITLRACRLVPALPGRKEPIPVLFLDARAVIAVAEEGRDVDEQPGREAPAAARAPAV